MYIDFLIGYKSLQWANTSFHNGSEHALPVTESVIRVIFSNLGPSYQQLTNISWERNTPSFFFVRDRHGGRSGRATVELRVEESACPACIMNLHHFHVLASARAGSAHDQFALNTDNDNVHTCVHICIAVCCITTSR